MIGTREKTKMRTCTLGRANKKGDRGMTTTSTKMKEDVYAVPRTSTCTRIYTSSRGGESEYANVLHAIIVFIRKTD